MPSDLIGGCGRFSARKMRGNQELEHIYPIKLYASKNASISRIMLE